MHDVIEVLERQRDVAREDLRRFDRALAALRPKPRKRPRSVMQPRKTPA